MPRNQFRLLLQSLKVQTKVDTLCYPAEIFVLPGNCCILKQLAWNEMMTESKNRIRNIVRLVAAGLGVLVWLIINLRVSAGVASPLERTLDGLVAGGVLLIAVFWAISFFFLPHKKNRENNS